jgi:hypothetical protein
MKKVLPQNLIIAVDFDGTCVTHEYPEVGRDIGAVPYLKALSDAGVKLILWTMRSSRIGEVNKHGVTEEVDTLQQAVDWFTSHQIKLFGVNQNPDQGFWSKSPKAYAHLYLDDASFGTPMVECNIGPEEFRERPYVDWSVVGPALLKIAELDGVTVAPTSGNQSP